jgi:hypothetical protein
MRSVFGTARIDVSVMVPFASAAARSTERTWSLLLKRLIMISSAKEPFCCPLLAAMQGLQRALPIALDRWLLLNKATSTCCLQPPQYDLVVIVAVLDGRSLQAVWTQCDRRWLYRPALRHTSRTPRPPSRPGPGPGRRRPEAAATGSSAGGPGCCWLLAVCVLVCLRISHRSVRDGFWIVRGLCSPVPSSSGIAGCCWRRRGARETYIL